MHFPPDVVHFLMLSDCVVVLHIEQHKILGQIFTSPQLFDQALVLLLELDVNIYLLN